MIRHACCGLVVVAIAAGFPLSAAEPTWPRLPLDTPRAIQIAVGPRHACARMADLTLRCWGEVEHEPWPYKVDVRQFAVATPYVTGVMDVEVGDARTCVRLATGHRRCWGSPASDGSHTCSLDHDATVRCASARDPHRRVVAVRDAVQLANGRDFTCALRRDRTVWCWGRNHAYELGNGTTTPEDMPARVPGLGDVVELVAAESHACVRRSTGTLACWGVDPPVSTARTPMPVRGVGRAVQVATASAYACALLDDGQIACWGRGVGVLGDAISVAQEIPTRVKWTPPHVSSRGLPPGTHAVSVAALDGTACALLDDGTVWCWGRIGDAESWLQPRQVEGLTDVVKIEAGLAFTATDKDGVVIRWQPGERPVILQRAITVVREPGLRCVLGLDHVATCRDDLELRSLKHAVQLVVTGPRMCVLLETQSVSCLELGTWTDVPALRGATQLAMYGERGCVRLSWGDATCWDQASRKTHPIDLRHVAAVYVGSNRVCARTEAGRMWCSERDGPSVEIPVLFGARTIAMAAGYACAVLDGDVVCQGSNQSGELGDGTNIDHDAWMRVAW